MTVFSLSASWAYRANGSVRRLNALPRDVKLVLATTLASNLGSFMVVPILSVYLASRKDGDVASVGFLLGVLFSLQHGGSIIGGLVADRIGCRPVMLIGLALRIPGFLLIGFGEQLSILFAAAVLLGIGYSFYLPAAKSALVRLVDLRLRVRVLALRTIAASMGTALGPVVGALVFAISARMLFVIAAAVFFLITVVNITLHISHTRQENRIFLAGLSSVIWDQRLWFLSIVTFLYWASYIQLEVIAPMFAFASYGPPGVTTLFVVNAVVVIGSQALFAERIAKGFPGIMFSVGFLCMAICFFLFNTAGEFLIVLVIAVAIFSLGEVFLSLRLDFDASNLSVTHVATCYGILSIAAALGNFAGSVFGSAFYAGAGEEGRNEAWLYIGIGALVAAATVFGIARAISLDRDFSSR